MEQRTEWHFRRALGLSILLAGFQAAPAFAAPGCTMRNLATYHIGQTTYIDVSNGIPVGTLVREGRADGEGKLLLVCNEGTVTFRGRWQNGNPPDGLLPLTIGGRPSGFGIRLYLQENGGGPRRPFPHDFTRTFNQDDTVTSDQDVVSYEIYRMNGRVEFGDVDAGPIAQSNVDRANGGIVVFRSMEIFKMIFRRPSCSITSDSINQEVNVGNFHISDFENADRATPWKEFRLTVEECKEPDGLIASFTFGTPSDADTDAPDFFSLRGAPGNVALEVGDSKRNRIMPGVPAEFAALGTGEDFVFNVRMRHTKGSVGGGEFRRPVVVTVNFM